MAHTKFVFAKNKESENVETSERKDDNFWEFESKRHRQGLTYIRFGLYKVWYRQGLTYTRFGTYKAWHKQGLAPTRFSTYKVLHIQGFRYEKFVACKVWHIQGLAYTNFWYTQGFAHKKFGTYNSKQHMGRFPQDGNFYPDIGLFFKSLGGLL